MDNAHANHLAKTRAKEKLMTRASNDSVFRGYWFRKMCEEKGLLDEFGPQSISRVISNPGHHPEVFLNEYILWERLEPSVRIQAEYEYEKWKVRVDREYEQWRASQKRQREEEKSSRSRRIQQRVKEEVWRRDEGKCVKCGSRERLEYDHIIPFSKGGSNTARNIELLCEKCNRRKGSKI
jgi:5-methylcytosine-specific restriction endonuclease McrA